MVSRGWSDRHGIIADLVGGGTAGVLSWLLVLPFDVIKSQMQADFAGKLYSNWIQAARVVYAKSGWQGFFTGLVAMSLRAFPVNAITVMVSFQSVKVLNNFSAS